MRCSATTPLAADSAGVQVEVGLVAYEFKLPDLGEGLTEGEIARWLVSEGQEIGEDDRLVEIATDKTTVEIPSPAAGLVSKVLAAEVDVVPVGTVVDGGDLLYLDRYDIGVAVQTEQGLVVPVVRDVAAKSLAELDAEIRRLADAAHAGKLAPEELRDGTFTVTSAGKSAGLFTTPLVNHPQVAILGVYRIADRPVVRDGELAVRRVGNISVTFDHRVIDGKRAADFGLAVIAGLQQQ